MPTYQLLLVNDTLHSVHTGDCPDALKVPLGDDTRIEIEAMSVNDIIRSEREWYRTQPPEVERPGIADATEWCNRERPASCRSAYRPDFPP